MVSVSVEVGRQKVFPFLDLVQDTGFIEYFQKNFLIHIIKEDNLDKRNLGHVT